MSVFFAGSSDGAHRSAMPLVPWAQLTTGKPPLGAVPSGTTMVPVTATGLSPVSVLDRYITRYTVPCTPGALTFSDLRSVPGLPLSGWGTE